MERSAVILMGIPLCVICCFPLAAFNICSLFLIFINLINICLGVFHLGFILFGTPWVSWTWVQAISFLPHFREVFNYYVHKYFLMVFLFVIFFWDPYDSNVVAFNIVLEVSEIVLISFTLSDSFISTILSSNSLILSSASVILLFVASRVFLFHLLHYSLYIDSFLFLLGPC